MSKTHFYDSHDFDLHILEGSALRLTHGYFFTRASHSMASVLREPRKYPFIYSICGVGLVSGAFWASIAFLILH